MRKRVKNFIDRVTLKDMREMLHENLTDIQEDKENKEVTLFICRRNAMNIIRKSKNIGSVLRSVKNGYGSNYRMTMKLLPEFDNDTKHIGLPYILHY